MYCAYDELNKQGDSIQLNKQGDSIQSCCTSFPVFEL